MQSFQGIITVVISLIGAFAFFKYILLTEIRLDQNWFKIIYYALKDENKIIIEEELTTDDRYPVVYSSICFIKGCPLFFISHNERLLNAGFEGKEYITNLICFRWNLKKIKKFLFDKKSLCLNKISVELLVPYSTDKIGDISKNDMPKYKVENELCDDLEKEIYSNKKKTGAILFGSPGNGKTSFVKYLALKYSLPIKIITFNPDWSNIELLSIFSQIPKNCIILFEDFDNYFEKRKCIIGEDNKNIKFTFDIILNALDGIYNTYEGVTFIMTTNDINKIDDSLKYRPSRFKYIIEFKNPSIETREKIFNNLTAAQKTEGLSLDQVLKVKEFLESGYSIEKSMEKITK